MTEEKQTKEPASWVTTIDLGETGTAKIYDEYGVIEYRYEYFFVPRDFGESTEKLLKRLLQEHIEKMDKELVFLEKLLDEMEGK